MYFPYASLSLAQVLCFRLWKAVNCPPIILLLAEYPTQSSYHEVPAQSCPSSLASCGSPYRFIRYTWFELKSLRHHEEIKPPYLQQTEP